MYVPKRYFVGCRRKLEKALSHQNKLLRHLVIIWYNMESHIEVMNLYLHIYASVMQSAIEVNLLTRIVRIIGLHSHCSTNVTNM